MMPKSDSVGKAWLHFVDWCLFPIAAWRRFSLTGKVESWFLADLENVSRVNRQWTKLKISSSAITIRWSVMACLRNQTMKQWLPSPLLRRMRLTIRASEKEDDHDQEEIDLAHEPESLDFIVRQHHRCIQRLEKEVTQIKAVGDEPRVFRIGYTLVERYAHYASRTPEKYCCDSAILE